MFVLAENVFRAKKQMSGHLDGNKTCLGKVLWHGFEKSRSEKIFQANVNTSAVFSPLGQA